MPMDMLVWFAVTQSLPLLQSKRDNAMVVVKWYYRPTEVPDLVYQMLIKDRINQVGRYPWAL